MTYKVLTKENVSDILHLYQSHFADGWNENMLSSAFDGGRFLCVGAYLGDVLAGVITCTVNFDDADIEGVVVRPQDRRKGIASALIDFVQKELNSKNMKKIFLEVRDTNDSAINLYKKHGFNQISVRKKYYSDGEDALVMVKEI